MTSRLILFVMFPCLLIALLLSLAGVHQVEFGDTYYTFLSGVTHSFDSWSFEIPNIPKIPRINDGGFDDSGLILGVLIKIGNFLVTIINAIISVLNILVTIVNVVIQIIQFCLTLIWSLINFRDTLANGVNFV